MCQYTSSVTGVVFPYEFLEQQPLIYEFKGITPPEMLDLPGCCGFENSKKAFHIKGNYQNKKEEMI